LHRLRRTGRGAPPSEACSLSGAGQATLATAAAGKGGLRIVAVDAAACALGIRSGMSLADARALSPTLVVEPADPPADRRALSALADWCCRYTPWAAIDRDACHGGEFGGGAGLWLDVSGCAHLFGGEEALLRDLLARLAALGFTAKAAIAETAGAAWAIAHFGGQRIAVLPDGAAASALARLPVQGLRLPPEIATALRRIGLRLIGDLLPLPRAPLAARFGDPLLRRLDQALGRLDEPLSPRLPPPAFHARLAFAEPIGRTEDIALALRHLLVDLCVRLEAAHKGARRLELAAFRSDGTVERAAVGTSRPTRTPDHLRRLFREQLDRLDPGFGIEVMTLGGLVVDPLAPAQAAIGLDDDAGKAESLAQLVDRLGNRLGCNAVVRLAEHPSHIPERACREVPALMGIQLGQTSERLPSPSRSRGPLPLPRAGEGSVHSERVRAAGSTAYESPSAADASRGSRQPRPLHLLASPEPIEVIAPVPDGPPVLFRWRRTRYPIASAEGPERIGPEWWLIDGGHDEALSRIRDYYRVEDNDGLRFWIYREGFFRPDRPPRWYLHGIFG
jgi:protein ImuB